MQCAPALIYAMMHISSAKAQPEARIYAGIYEKIGIAGGYSLERTTFDLSGTFRVEHPPANNYVIMSHPWSSRFLFDEAMQTFAENTWQENTKIFTARVLRWEKGNYPRFRLYYGIFVRCIMKNATPDEQGWSAADKDFMEDNRMPVLYKDVNVFAGFSFGARGQIKGNIFWDANLGFKLIPWFYQYAKLTYNDGTSDMESYQRAGYQYHAPGDFILQAGLGYKFSRRVAR
jgi:hypothetical protein